MVRGELYMGGYINKYVQPTASSRDLGHAALSAWRFPPYMEARGLPLYFSNSMIYSCFR